MSKFKLISSRGEIPLNGENDLYIRSVTGLGSDITEEFSNVISGYFMSINSKVNQTAINGKLVFAGTNPAQQYKNLADFIFKSEPLTLYYQVEDTEDPYYRTVKIRSLSKTEFKEKNKLTADISFYCLDPWYREEILQPVTEGGSKYSVVARGQLPSAFVITYEATSASNNIYLRKSENVIYGQCSFTLPAGYYNHNTFTLSTKPNDAYVKLSGLNNFIKYINPLSNPFFTLPTDFTTADIRIPNGAEKVVKAIHYWRSV